MEIKKIVIGSDHAGFALKQRVKDHLAARGIDVIDVGTGEAVSCNYTIFAHELCETITRGDAPLGILICGTGIGMSMAANKHRGIRAACCSDTFSARLTREHNDANVLCFGARVVGQGLALELVNAFVDAEFEGGKHKTRVDLITAIENGNSPC